MDNLDNLQAPKNAVAKAANLQFYVIFKDRLRKAKRNQMSSLFTQISNLHLRGQCTGLII